MNIEYNYQLVGFVPLAICEVEQIYIDKKKKRDDKVGKIESLPGCDSKKYQKGRLFDAYC